MTQATAGQLVAGTSNRCDDLQGQDLVPSQKYNSVNGTATFEVTDWLTVFADGFWSRREFTRLPAYLNASLTVPQANAFFVRPAGFTGTSYALDYNFSRDVAAQCVVRLWRELAGDARASASSCRTISSSRR